ncbi:MAG: Uncharacterized protein, PA2063/DUF2235 family [Chloroflexi bacterium]|nr:MAG: Uncharacterized protein, PA2063/DUF2235 family [Chloroflexota bacterium]
MPDPKRIITLSDGTWGKVDSSPTNVVHIARALRPYNSPSQCCFYDRGVGSARSLINKVFGGVFGLGLNKNITDAYSYIVEKYEPGDHIYLCGFSRGAYTACSVAGMIRKCGILKREHAANVADAFTLYRDADHPNDPAPTKFRDDFSHPKPEIRFLGVWDTVGAHGIPVPKLRDRLTRIPGLGRWHRERFEFHDVELSRIVKNAYHALAIDERRAAFTPTLWDYAPKRDDQGHPVQHVEQRWFVGDHSDIGGGHDTRELSDVALHWIAQKLVNHGAQLNLPNDGNVMTGPSRSPSFLMRPFGVFQRIIQANKLGPPLLHHTLSRRWNNDAGYRPANLPSDLIDPAST